MAVAHAHVRSTELSNIQDDECKDAKGRAASLSSFAWYDVRCSYTNKAGSEKTVLHGVSGYLEGGQMLAVIGPSGGGKTCLMDVLAGRKSVGRMSATRLLNGSPVDESSLKRLSAYLSQDDVFHPTSTVQEAVMFQAHLRLGLEVGAASKQARVLRVLEEVGLQKKANDYVGGELPGGLNLRGLSGGEKRRLSLCCATITEPALLFLDEPTSGLDSFSALVVMNQLKKYCKNGMTVICAIHQPRSAIWALFEKVLVLSAGHELYFGPADKADWWFGEVLGYARPHDASASDYLLDVINIDYQGKEARQSLPFKGIEGETGLQDAAARFRASQLYHTYIGKFEKEGVPSRRRLATTDRTSVAYSLRLWFWQRSARTYVRNPGNLGARFFVVLFVSSVQALFYYKTGANSDTTGPAMNIWGSLYMNLLVCAMLPFNSITMFLFDRRYFVRESASGLYHPGAYFLGYVLLETVLCSLNGAVMGIITYFGMDYGAFAGSNASWSTFFNYLVIIIMQMNVSNKIAIFWSLLSPNQDIARAIITGYTGISVFVGGYFVPRPSMSSAALITSYMSEVRFSFQASMINLLTGTHQEKYLDVLQLRHPATVEGNMANVSLFYFAYLAGCYICLRYLNKERR